VAVAALIAAVVQGFSIGVLAPRLPRVVGPPDVVKTKTYRISGAPLFRLTNADGAVVVETHAAPDINILARVKAYTREADRVHDASAYVDNAVVVNVTPEAISVVTEPDERPDYLELRVDYSIVLPEGTDVVVEGSNGNVRIARGCGAVTVVGGNTDIDINRPSGNVVARSTNGRIRLWDASASATLETVNGNVYTHMRGGSLWASTTNGAIVARLLRPDVIQCTLSSLNGGITLTLANGCSVRMDASTERGMVRSDLPIQYTEGGNRRRHLRGDIGDGMTKVSMETINGSIWIMKE
jgi:DUF4097 and DUF4098 domain-containing protein YvlB